MKKVIVFLLLQAVWTVQAQTLVKDLFAQAPDSVFPLLTTNNRLDCIDLIENGRKAQVKNRLDQAVEMLTLTESYLKMRMSAKSVVEMKMLGDSLCCLVRTFEGPAPDSEVAFYNAAWERVDIAFGFPAVDEFWTPVPDSLQRDAAFARRSLQDICLVQVQADEKAPELVLTLQTSELVGKEKEIAQRYVQPLRFRWNGKTFERVAAI